MRFVLPAVLGLVMCAGCGGTGGGAAGATTDTPSGTITLFIDALERGDIDAYIALLPLEDRRRAEMSRKAAGEEFDSSLEGAMDSMKAVVAGGEVVGEEIIGSRATVRVKNRSGAEVTWKCVEDADGWRVAVGR
jgi:hypothetical protein